MERQAADRTARRCGDASLVDALANANTRYVVFAFSVKLGVVTTWFLVPLALAASDAAGAVAVGVGVGVAVAVIGLLPVTAAVPSLTLVAMVKLALKLAAGL